MTFAWVNKTFPFLRVYESKYSLGHVTVLNQRELKGTAIIFVNSSCVTTVFNVYRIKSQNVQIARDEKKPRS